MKTKMIFWIFFLSILGVQAQPVKTKAKADSIRLLKKEHGLLIKKTNAFFNAYYLMKKLDPSIDARMAKTEDFIKEVEKNIKNANFLLQRYYTDSLFSEMGIVKADTLLFPFLMHDSLVNQKMQKDPQYKQFIAEDKEKIGSLLFLVSYAQEYCQKILEKKKGEVKKKFPNAKREDISNKDYEKLFTELENKIKNKKTHK